MISFEDNNEARAKMPCGHVTNILNFLIDKLKIFSIIIIGNKH
jgi:hypothetical protein